MQAAIQFDRFNALADEQAQERILAARARLGRRAVLLCHHYQRADVYHHADLTGTLAVASSCHKTSRVTRHLTALLNRAVARTIR